MSETKMWRYLAATLVACVTLTGVGCAQDVGDIDRSQPNKIKKSDFDQSQEWYYRMMIADSDVQGSLIFQGLMSETKRVRFIITEDVLFALRPDWLDPGRFHELVAASDRMLGELGEDSRSRASAGAHGNGREFDWTLPRG